MLVDALAEMGCVERHPSPGDRRAYSLAMTPRGTSDLADITAAVRAHDARMAQHLSTDEAQQLMGLPEQVAKKLAQESRQAATRGDRAEAQVQPTARRG